MECIFYGPTLRMAEPMESGREVGTTGESPHNSILSIILNRKAIIIGRAETQTFFSG